MKQAILTYNGVSVDDIESCDIIENETGITLAFNKKPKINKTNGVAKFIEFVGTMVFVLAVLGAVIGIAIALKSVRESQDASLNCYIAQMQLSEALDELEEAHIRNEEEINYAVAPVRMTKIVEEETEVIVKMSDNKSCMLPSGVDTSFKAYMDYRTITDTTTKQYALQQNAWTGVDGVRRVGDDICVAMGTYYTDECGKRFKITLDTGKTFTVIVSDIKADKDTDETNMYSRHGENGEYGCVLEFIVDENKIGELAGVLGDISCNNFEGRVINIEEL